MELQENAIKRVKGIVLSFSSEDHLTGNSATTPIDTQDPCGFPHFTRRKITLGRKKWRAISGGGRGTSASPPKPIGSSPRIVRY